MSGSDVTRRGGLSVLLDAGEDVLLERHRGRLLDPLTGGTPLTCRHRGGGGAAASVTRLPVLRRVPRGIRAAVR